MITRNRPKILHVVPGLQRGGIENWLTALLSHDSNLRQWSDVCLTGQVNGEQGELADILISSGVRIFTIPYGTGGKRIRFIRDLAAAIERDRYSVVHSHLHHLSAFVAIAARLAGTKSIISHFHMPVLHVHYNWSQRLKISLLTQLIKILTTCILCSSDAVAGQLARFPRSSETIVHYCGIDLSAYDRLPRRSEAKNRITLNADSFVAGHVGNFREEKNHQFLLEVMKELCREKPEARLVLVGDGPLRTRIENSVNRMELTSEVVLTGSRDDVPAIMKSFDVFLLPSLYEGFGLVVLEAQAAGVPCLVSDRVSREVEVIDGLVEFLPLEAGPQAWAEKAVEMADRKAPPLEERLAEIDRRGMSIAASARRLEELYSRLADESPNTRC
jgi:glycosyltransferase EpsF